MCVPYWRFIHRVHTFVFSMFTDAIRSAGPGVKLAFFGFIAVAGVIATSLLALGLGYLLLGGSEFLANIQPESFSFEKDAIIAQKFMQGFYTIGLFIVPPVVFALLNKERPLVFLELNQKPQMRSMAYAAILMLASIPLVNFTYALNQQFPFPDSIAQLFKTMEENAAKITEAFLADKSTLSLITNLVLIAVLPAVGEEFFFRGVLQKQFSNWFKNEHIAILVTAFLFSALHMQFYGFLPRFILGIFLGYLFVWSRNLWLPILAHFVTNGFTVLVTHYSKFADPDKLEKIGTLENSSFQFAFYSAMLVSVMLYGVYQTELKRRSQSISFNKETNEHE